MLKQASFLAAVLTLAGAAHAEEWTGPDKTEHFVAGALISFGAARVTTPTNAFLLGTVAGLVKEVRDSRTTGHTATYQDFVVTAVGAAVGAYAPGLVLGRRSISYRWDF